LEKPELPFADHVQLIEPGLETGDTLRGEFSSVRRLLLQRSFTKPNETAAVILLDELS
jgi:hypothetical protein